MHNLSAFDLPINRVLDTFERLIENPQIAMALDRAETPLGFQVGKRSPVLDRLAIAPAAHPARDHAQLPPLWPLHAERTGAQGIVLF